MPTAGQRSEQMLFTGERSLASNLSGRSEVIAAVTPSSAGSPTGPIILSTVMPYKAVVTVAICHRAGDTLSFFRTETGNTTCFCLGLTSDIYLDYSSDPVTPCSEGPTVRL
ncbi:hypothetical protein Bbelb_284970 [Branchiostoma belcheri]|nr:hypothetical protein Bbelb_284970 [Branchiostoma belcheri]